ncbi:HtaA domain-containing protein [Gordonia alkanivorans]|uniref:HtaA domain-containing protein n=1 Tax=Gordonia alkanivorans TaxID=84096 RepID=UPI00244D0328|nr:HtaA domain-containing protein [Gordonia alkanivorans]MDH3047135.1 HtaA domain-containing protein [Gordonia alkanivorans]
MTSGASTAGIEWAVHARFLRYLATLADGACRIGDGVRTTAEGAFLFPRPVPAGSDVPGLDAAVADAAVSDADRCDGFVEFSGHSGVLNVWLARPGVEAREGRWVLAAEIDRTGTRAAIADLNRTREGPRSTTFDVSLREEAVGVFGGVYEAGQSLAPLVLHHLPRPGRDLDRTHSNEMEKQRWPVAEGLNR